MAKDKNRFASQASKKRKQRGIQVNFLIVCEGTETEKNYFNAFPKNYNNLRCDVTCKPSDHPQPMKVLESAIRLSNNKTRGYYSRIWVVFDKDDNKDFQKAIELAEKEGIEVAWSNEAFELWYVLHFVFRNTPMTRKQYKAEIEKHINKGIGEKSKFDYEKNATDMYTLLNHYGSQNKAINNAQKLCDEHQTNGVKQECANPCTRVHKLVNEMTDVDLLTEIAKKSLK